MNLHAQARLVDALSLALEVHAKQTRKGRDIPYASHLLQVAGLILEHGGDAELAAAGLLHDALEDSAEVDADALSRRFGERISRVVVDCSDLLPGDTPTAKSPWLSRKRRYLDQLRDASDDARLVAACDKLHNLRTILADLDSEGLATLERFTASPSQSRAYYEAVRDVVSESIPAPLGRELDSALNELANWVPESNLEDS